MMQHGIAGPADQSLFAKLARRIWLAGIKGRRGAANDVLGDTLVHAGHIRTTARACKEGQSRVFAKRPGVIPAFAFFTAVIVRESGRSSTPRLLDSISDGCDYWIPAFAGMTA
jgi:hypothetical protein